ncbi:MAG: peptide chain release factor N(5)-glutamine methyltransferase [Ferruginibacter sp.]
MTAREAYRQFLLQLQDIYPLGEATAITDLVFESVCATRKADLIKDPQKTITARLLAELEEAKKALLQHQPVQYVLGEAWFYHLKLKVNEYVLIPRPETEELVATILEDLQKVYQLRNGQAPRNSGLLNILDIGTGSGCISIALKKNWAAARLTAIDASAGALALAAANARQHHCSIDFQQIDFLEEAAWEKLPAFDMIVSNPPYIPIEEKSSLDKHVADWEPHLALFVPGNDPLLFYRKIAAFGRTHLAPGGRICLEMHAPLAAATAALFETGYSRVQIKKDMFGLERMLLVSY